MSDLRNENICFVFTLFWIELKTDTNEKMFSALKDLLKNKIVFRLSLVGTVIAGAVVLKYIFFYSSSYFKPYKIMNRYFQGCYAGSEI